MNKTTDSSTSDNHVFLRGRLADVPVLRELPSGDVLAVFRLTVARPVGQRVRVDSIECATTKVRAHKTLARACAGDELELSGSLHRRFWRTPAGPASRYAVDADTVRIMTAGRRGGASRVQRPASV
jgi:single-strand DNA-binding protein